jgi:hypothetical protein
LVRRFLSVAVIGATVVVAVACGSSTTSTTPADTALGFASTPGSEAGTAIARSGGDTGTTQKPGTTTSTSSSSSSSSASSSSTSSTGGGGGGSVSQADFDSQVGALCADFQSQGDTIFQGSSPSQADFDKAIAFLKDFLVKVKAVGIPQGKEQAAAAFYAAWDTFVTVFQQYGPEIISGKEPPSSALADLEKVTTDVENTSKALGNFTTCFAGSSTSSGGK